MENHHHHHHHHHHHVVKAENKEILIFSVILNLLFVIIEAIVGWTQNSLSLLSDAGHNLSDVFSLLMVLVGFMLLHVHSNARYTYGYKKSTVLISLLNAVILLVAVGVIVVESVHKFSHPAPVNGAAISWTAGIGIVINAATALLLMRGQKQDLNMRGAFLHMVADTLVSVGVVVSGLIIIWTGWTLIDPIISLVIAGVILVSTWGLLSDSLRLSLDGIPEGVDTDAVRQNMLQVPAVKDVHHVHIWAMSTTQNALTAHIMVADWQDIPAVKQQLKQMLVQKGITHSTLEFETAADHCHDTDCSCEE